MGWLVTKKYQTTTILYYAFFLPGIFLHELVLWTVAGFLNVRADRAISWPEKQEIGELKLNFVKLSKNVDPIRLAIISTTPLIVGLVAVALIANNILDFRAFLDTLSTGYLEDVATAVGQLVSAPDFWLWIYLTLTISNTMFPDAANLRGWRIILGIIVVIGVLLFFVGAGSEVLALTLVPVTTALNALSSTLGIIIIINLVMVAVLGTIESIIERLTGDSATFKNGKMITMSREEMLQQRQQALTSARTKKPAPAAAPAGPPSIYALALPIPGSPGKEPVTRGGENILISPSPAPGLSASSPPSVTRNEPSVIPGTSSTSDRPAIPAASRPAASPFASQGRPASPTMTSPQGRPSLPSSTSAPPSDILDDWTMNLMMTERISKTRMICLMTMTFQNESVPIPQTR